RQFSSNSPVIFTKQKIPSIHLCNGDFDLPIVFEFHSASDKTLLGSAEISVNKLLEEKKFTIQGQKVIINVRCNNIQLVKEHTFIDYLRGGTQIGLTIGIDFTGSNGHQNDAGSLHTMKQVNPYQNAIRSCG